jgi:hypothetical protein
VDYSRPELKQRLDALSAALDEFPPGVSCPWPLARIFNELLKQAKQDITDDPILKIIRYIEEAPSEHEMDGSSASTGTVRALITQLSIVLGVQDRPAARGSTKSSAKAKTKPKAT